VNIHLIEHMNNFAKLSDNVWESGWWTLDENKAQKLVGGEIFFHKKKQEPSFYGGTILGYRVEQDGEYEGKIIFNVITEGVLDFRVGRGEIREDLYLEGAGEARTHFQHFTPFLHVIVLHNLIDFRAGTYNTHIPLEDIEELG
jgi:hypothetical protein